MSPIRSSINKAKPLASGKGKKKKQKPEPEVEEAASEQEEEILQELLAAAANQQDAGPKFRSISLYGNIDEEIANDVVFSMMALKEYGKREYLDGDPNDLENAKIVTLYEPFDLTISTFGGSAADMFAIYDTMRMVREVCDINTLGLGKVMSAGVLLLAAGTKGKRRIGKNCRVMIHSVVGGSAGQLHDLENEMEEMRWIQEKHIECLVQETDMTRAYLKKLLNRKVNVYLTAEEAVELGIADEVV
jgi:ATP-dependent Clp protease protease subunit